METCIWCDSAFENRIELEYHVEQEHPFARSSVKIKL
ncbi:MAG: hypothetical protein QT00_C0001G0341 [archaeon GW2011_AR5]|nr:MAG: hypothetical protein QT00_C0001G0341 [archaeon GW2011_AR5]